ncbi:FtsX-like permease family protein [Candidatus Woesearchaeota archaeon]|nr:FtsX-like permease family protein [Candidatus Woesearchaeota archaeon]
MIKDYFKLAFHSLKGRSVRTWLTMIGIFIGITAVVSLISLGQGMQSSINAEFEKIGKNRIMITPGSGQFGPGGESMFSGNMTEDDLEVVRKVKGVDIATATISKSGKVKFKDEVEFMSVWGYSTDADAEALTERTSFLDVEEGRQLKKGDKRKAVIGYDVAYDTFEKDVRVGDKILIQDIEFKVIGIQKKAGTGVHDSLARIPLEQAREVYDKPETVSTIFALTELTEPPGEVAERIKKDLRRHRDVDEDEEDFSVQTAEQMISQLNTILGIVTIFVVGIAAISLLVGGIGIMNTMYTTVLERTKEIGIMKSIGARNSNIMLLFLFESGILGLAGGIVGVVIGLGISKVGEIIAQNLGADIFHASFSPFIIIGALVFAYFVGTMSGILPARQASRMNPVDALRSSK